MFLCGKSQLSNPCSWDHQVFHWVVFHWAFFIWALWYNTSYKQFHRAR